MTILQIALRLDIIFADHELYSGNKLFSRIQDCPGIFMGNFELRLIVELGLKYLSETTRMRLRSIRPLVRDGIEPVPSLFQLLCSHTFAQDVFDQGTLGHRTFIELTLIYDHGSDHPFIIKSDLPADVTNR